MVNRLCVVMAGNLIATVPKASMHALAYQGIMAYTCHSQICELLMRKFGEEYALLFAKPVENKTDDQIDWYSQALDKARPLPEFTDEEKKAFFGILSGMGQNILKYAEELVESGNSQKITRGNILKLALNYPSESSLFMAGKQPVLTCWGFEAATPGVKGYNLSRLCRENANSVITVINNDSERDEFELQQAPVQKTEALQASGIEKQKTGAAAEAGVLPIRKSRCWLWWLYPLIAALLLILALCVSFPGFPALSGFSLLQFDYIPFLSHEDSTRELARLEREITGLESRVNSYAALCVSGEQGSETPGQMVEPTIPDNARQLVIPDNDKDLAFLEGEWICKTGLCNVQTGAPVQFAFTFDKNGKGKGIVYEDNDTCTGAAVGNLQNGILRLSLEGQKCANSNRVYSELQIMCSNAMHKTSTECQGFNSNGSSWDATFYRLR